MMNVRFARDNIAARCDPPHFLRIKIAKVYGLGHVCVALNPILPSLENLERRELETFPPHQRRRALEKRSTFFHLSSAPVQESAARGFQCCFGLRTPGLGHSADDLTGAGW